MVFRIAGTLIGVHAQIYTACQQTAFLEYSLITPYTNNYGFRILLIFLLHRPANQLYCTLSYRNSNFFPPGSTQPILGVCFTALYRVLASSHTRLLDHTQRRTTVGRTPLIE